MLSHATQALEHGDCLRGEVTRMEVHDTLIVAEVATGM